MSFQLICRRAAMRYAATFFCWYWGCRYLFLMPLRCRWATRLWERRLRDTPMIQSPSPLPSRVASSFVLLRLLLCPPFYQVAPAPFTFQALAAAFETVAVIFFMPCHYYASPLLLLLFRYSFAAARYYLRHYAIIDADILRQMTFRLFHYFDSFTLLFIYHYVYCCWHFDIFSVWLRHITHFFAFDYWCFRRRCMLWHYCHTLSPFSPFRRCHYFRWLRDMRAASCLFLSSSFCYDCCFIIIYDVGYADDFLRSISCHNDYYDDCRYAMLSPFIRLRRHYATCAPHCRHCAILPLSFCLPLSGYFLW